MFSAIELDDVLGAFVLLARYVGVSEGPFPVVPESTMEMPTDMPL